MMHNIDNKISYQIKEHLDMIINLILLLCALLIYFNNFPFLIFKLFEVKKLKEFLFNWYISDILFSEFLFCFLKLNLLNLDFGGA